MQRTQRKTRSTLEISFAAYCRMLKLPPPTPEFKFHPTRKWRFDFAWPEHKIAVELDGATWTGGRHVRGAGYKADCEKCNAAALAGWRVFRFVADHVETGSATYVIQQALEHASPSS